MENDYKLEIILQGDYILAETSGIETPENMLDVYEQIINKVIEWKCNRVLYIEGFSNQISMEEMMLVWRKIFKLVGDRDIEGRIAVFDKNKDDFSINMVSESLAGAQGINAKVFSSINNALAWLRAPELSR